MGFGRGLHEVDGGCSRLARGCFAAIAAAHGLTREFYHCYTAVIRAQTLSAAQRQASGEQPTLTVSAARGSAGGPLLQLMNRRYRPKGEIRMLDLDALNRTFETEGIWEAATNFCALWRHSA